MTQGAMGLSGAALGLLGIGLPEIPVLIAQILRLANQTCIGYGFDPSNENERIFMLGILCTAVSEGEQYASYSALTDRIGRQIDLEKTCERSLAKMIPEASKCICDRLAVSKVIQGVPIVGVVGGVVNFQMTGKVGRIAAIKYKKRFLQKLL